MQLYYSRNTQLLSLITFSMIIYFYMLGFECLKLGLVEVFSMDLYDSPTITAYLIAQPIASPVNRNYYRFPALYQISSFLDPN